MDSGISEVLKKLDVDMDTYSNKIQRKLRDNQWFFTPSMDGHLWHHILNNINQQNDLKSFLNKAFVNYFSSDNFDNLDYMATRWNSNSLINNRFHILIECVSVLKDSTYENSNIINPHHVIIPTLIAQINGLMNAYLLKNGFEFQGLKLKNTTDGTKGKTEDLFKERVSAFLKDKYAKGSNVSIFLQEEGTTAIHILVDIVFQSAMPAEQMSDLTFPFCRNKILHGQHLDYGKAEDTIRLFLLIDFIAALG
jgi:hypothetical protein